MKISDPLPISPSDCPLSNSRTRFYKKGEVILRPNETSDYIYAVRSGLVKLYTCDDKGDQQILVIYGPEDLFPVGWIIEQRKNFVFFEALNDCEISLIPQERFLEQVHADADFSFTVMKKILEQFYLFNARTANLSLKFARERLAYRLLVLAARFGKTIDGAIVLPHLTQSDLANTINVSRENVSRELTRLERLQIVSYGRGDITIHDPEALRKEIGKNMSVLFYDEF